MRPTFRVLARYLEQGTPTGLTGLWTHGTPRSTLLYLYGSTLNKLQAFPEKSLYRQSVEAVTKHRMELVEKTVPPGYNKWAAKARELVSKNPEQFRVASGRVDGSEARTVRFGDRVFVVGAKHEEGDVRVEEWDGEEDEGGELEGIRTSEERKDQVIWAERKPLEDHEKVEWEDEPQLTADQCEAQLLVHGVATMAADKVSAQDPRAGAGHGCWSHRGGDSGGRGRAEASRYDAKIKGVSTRWPAGTALAVGHGSPEHAADLRPSWEDLEEQPAQGQWEYFDRNSM